MNPYVQYMYGYPHKTAYRPLEGVSLEQYVHFLNGNGHGLYVHLPFCQSKCGYCNLFSVTGQDEEAVDRYLQAFERQSRQYQHLLQSVRTQFQELTIGGGTPLYLTRQQLEQMFAVLEDCFSFADRREVIIETAPNQTDIGKLRMLKQAGVTRVSMGIQSFHNAELQALGRSHYAAAARQALHLVKDMGFSCVNTDFIYGIPGQTTESLLDSLKEALLFEPDEIFLYPLYVKHGAGLEYEGVVPDGEQAYIQYRHASRFLKSEGWRQDSMRRFVRQAKERQYQSCGFGTSLALGCGARSYLGNLHFCSPYAITKKECLARLAEYEHTHDYTKITHGILLTQQEQKRRYLIRHLLIMPGLQLDEYETTFGSSAITDFPVLQHWIESDYAQMQKSDPAFLALTETGLGLSDYLGPQLISPQIWAAMREWEEAHAHDSVSGKSEKL
uniref:Heme chaperone HemW n=1 Tax=Eubacterium plexicaudatum ASF492 TaxID=1235802 RepID=N2A130_9FIRM